MTLINIKPAFAKPDRNDYANNYFYLEHTYRIGMLYISNIKILKADLKLVGHRKSHTAVAVVGSLQQQAPFESSCHQ